MKCKTNSSQTKLTTKVGEPQNTNQWTEPPTATRQVLLELHWRKQREAAGPLTDAGQNTNSPVGILGPAQGQLEITAVAAQVPVPGRPGGRRLEPSPRTPPPQRETAEIKESGGGRRAQRRVEEGNRTGSLRRQAAQGLWSSRREHAKPEKTWDQFSEKFRGNTVTSNPKFAKRLPFVTTLLSGGLVQGIGRRGHCGGVYSGQIPDPAVVKRGKKKRIRNRKATTDDEGIPNKGTQS